MPGLPDLQVQVAALQGQVSTLATALAGHKARLESALTELAVASANGASVPQLITLTTEAVAATNAVTAALHAWADGEVSQTYIDSLLP